jgi:hypothetical protein
MVVRGLNVVPRKPTIGREAYPSTSLMVETDEDIRGILVPQARQVAQDSTFPPEYIKITFNTIARTN